MQMAGKGDMAWPKTPHSLEPCFFRECITLLLNQKLICYWILNLPLPRNPHESAMWNSEKAQDRRERQMYLSCTDDVGRRQKILSSESYWLQNKGTVINQQECRLRGNIDWIWRNFSFLKKLFPCKGNQESLCKLEWQPASQQPIWVVSGNPEKYTPDACWFLKSNLNTLVNQWHWQFDGLWWRSLPLKYHLQNLQSSGKWVVTTLSYF